MSKITLTNVYLLNWYGFVDKIIPMGKNLSLISGENECGKSTILDAIKYAFSADTAFNKATSATNMGAGKRTLMTYTRCLIDPDSRKFARPASIFPHVYTHIALEYYHELENTYFVLGVLIDTNASDDTESNWYAFDKKRISDIIFFDTKDDNKMNVLNPTQFKRRNRVELLNRDVGMDKFMMMVGLRLKKLELFRFQRKLKNIMTYNPNAKIQEFIKASILEDKSINLNKLKEAKRGIDDISTSFDLIEHEISLLQEIIDAFEKLHDDKDKLLKDDMKRAYKGYQKNGKNIDDNHQRIHTNEVESKHLNGLIKEYETKKTNVDDELMQARIRLNSVDGIKAIEDEKIKLKQLKEVSEEYKQKMQLLGSLSECIQQFKAVVEDTYDYDSLLHLEDCNISASIKNQQFYSFKTFIEKLSNHEITKRIELNNDLKEVEDELHLVVKTIQTCERNLPDYAYVSEQVALRDEINRRFKSLQIDSEANFSSSYVVAIKDESWRNAIESFLNIHRYSILVEDTYFDIANEVLDQSQHRYVELVNTKLLRRRKQEIVEDSLLHQLDIKNDIAYQYFAYWLGKIHAVSKNDVQNYDNAISKEGKISRNMGVSFLNFNKLKSYCLGEDAIKINRENALKKKVELEIIVKEYHSKIKIVDDRIERIKDMTTKLNHEYDFNAPSKFIMNERDISLTHDTIKELEQSLKDNNEYMTLTMKVSQLESESKQLETSMQNNRNKVSYMLSQIEVLKKENVLLERDLVIYKDKLDKFKEKDSSLLQIAKDEYDDFVDGIKKVGDVLKDTTRATISSNITTYTSMIANKQGEYNASRSQNEILPTGSDQEAIYRQRLNKLKVDNFEEIRQKLKEQTRKYELIFKNEFVLKIKTNIETALSDIKDINRQLHKLSFSTEYKFEVKTLNDTSDYAKILEYADYLKKTNRINDGQLMLGEVVDYDQQESQKREDEMKAIIDKIVMSNNDTILNDYADYRNYMTYEVIVTNDELDHRRLSKLAGYNSGAGTQIPYIIILSAALANIYNARKISTRLIFMDEPFEKMSDKNIKIMLEFFKSQDFQVIFCAPPNKLDSIGKECDAIIPVKKIKKSNMIIGVVKFHE